MQHRLFGRQTGLRVSSMILGTGLLGRTRDGTTSPEIARDLLDAYADAGGNMIDTSDAYQSGESERMIGKFLVGRRQDFVLSSKFGRGHGVPPAAATVGSSRKAMVEAVDASLRRLDTDRIDLYLAHLDDGVTPMEEIARGFDDLVSAGKIVYGGLSNFPAWKVAQAVAVARAFRGSPVAGIQVEYSLLQRTTERELLPMSEAFGLGLMAYSPLAGGLLTAKYRDPGMTGRATERKGSVPDADAARNERVIDVLIEIADQIGTNPGRVALAWVMAHGAFPIVGPRTVEQLADNLAASALTLDNEQLDRLDTVSATPLGYPHELLARHRAAT